MRRAFIALAALAALATTLSPPAANAADQGHGQVQSVADMEIDHYTLTQSTTDVPSFKAPKASGGVTALAAPFAWRCKSGTATVTAYAVLGKIAYTFTQDISFCYNGLDISNRASSHRQSSPYLTWSYNGLTSKSSSPGIPWIVRRTAEFRNCAILPWGPFCTEAYPWIKHTVWPSGQVYAEGAADGPSN